jgi:hypothetical protein
MKICSVLLFTALATMSALGQEAKASMSPTEVIAGKNITVTIKVNDASTVNGTQLLAAFVSDNPKDDPSGFDVRLCPVGNDPKVYSTSTPVPATAKGTWRLANVLLQTPNSGTRHVETNHPQLVIKPIKVTLPTTGQAEITVP